MKRYFEQRTNGARGTSSQTADITRHLHTRQYLGRVVIICDQPIAMLSAIRKQWLRLSRSMQHQRSATLNVDKILKYTHTITRMQRMQFTSKSPLDWMDADVYCLQPTQTIDIPDECFTVYITMPLKQTQAEVIISQLPDSALIVDYEGTDLWETLQLEPKSALEESVTACWHAVETFLQRHNIKPDVLFNGELQDVEAMDQALDTLLAVSKPFMALAEDFHETLALARPVRLAKMLRLKYDALALLAHRVQALSPGEYTQRFLETYNEDDSRYFRDSGPLELQIIQLTESRDHFLELGYLNIAAACSAKLKYLSRMRSGFNLDFS